MSSAPSFAATLVTEDGVRIDAAHTPPRGPDELGIVLAHGFTGSLRERPTRRITHVLSGFGGVISFDFRGHGRSGGESTVGDLEILDLDAAVRHARAIGYPRVAVVGFSMGAAVAVRHAGWRGRDGGPDGRGLRPDAVVAVSAPARWYYRGTRPMRQVHWAIERPLGRLAARVGKRTRIRKGVWDPVPAAPHEAAAHISPTPLLVVHGDADGFFPLDHAHQIYEAAREPKELWIEPGYGHAESAATPGLIRRIGEWAVANS
ncbi:alpha/beta fold hydrolase [Streptosporangium canum]|uniref:alpha/beta hydrolase n=1 Tax=Streptosporangium canum TaxID=324952 RepID=UPI0034339B0A